MGRVYAIAINTFREAVRDRVLYGMLGFSFAALLFSLALSELALDQQERIIQDIGLAAVSLSSVAAAIFLGSSLLYKEIERKTLYVILPRPLRRYEFLVGKYLGIVLTILVFLLLVGSGYMLVAALQAGAPPWAVLLVVAAAVGALAGLRFVMSDQTAGLLVLGACVLGAAGAVALHYGANVGFLVTSVALAFGEVMVLTAMAMLFSSFSSPYVTGLLTFGVWLVGRSADDLVAMKTELFSENLRAFLRLLGTVAPNLNLFVPSRHLLETRSATIAGAAQYLATAMGYGALYAALALVLASVIFRKRDFL